MRRKSESFGYKFFDDIFWQNPIYKPPPKIRHTNLSAQDGRISSVRRCWCDVSVWWGFIPYHSHSSFLN